MFSSVPGSVTTWASQVGGTKKKPLLSGRRRGNIWLTSASPCPSSAKFTDRPRKLVAEWGTFAAEPFYTCVPVSLICVAHERYIVLVQLEVKSSKMYLFDTKCLIDYHQSLQSPTAPPIHKSHLILPPDGL